MPLPAVLEELLAMVRRDRRQGVVETAPTLQKPEQLRHGARPAAPADTRGPPSGYTLRRLRSPRGGAARGLLLVPILLLMACAAKCLAALVCRPLFGRKDTFAIGTPTSTRLSPIIAAATVGVETGGIEQSTNAAIILVAIFSVIVYPIVSHVAPKPAPSPGTRVIIAGSAPQARLLAQRLGTLGDQVTLLTANRPLFQETQDSGLRALLAEKGRHAELPGEAGADRTDTPVSMIDDEDESLSLTRAAREGHGLETAVALVDNPNTARKFQAQGVRAADPGASTLMVLEGLIRHPHAFSLIAETGVSQQWPTSG